ncbi:hypothetical protein M409DRAFT_66851 [Zasmidium cellare ATCC 36951]|uniref:Nucleolar pre-ribosomal-associated protein 1 N-terminal domain-containing protein n=1 Tax=Zasmidium cellare ATCC 36951 TaxID=1080233 RepID=A0A6A6CF67_ZASCE|nr:uncharacterized protein M409DRAFT_66851 [Zasmidium cellare ATCC 36951]KAF2165877.1 hypothetical protein M409DRAFT_66851 [Zasmidium cellare ATCC 36951]
MSKRDRTEDGDDRPPKRTRQEHQPPKVEEIHFARQLQDLLVFRQDGIQQLRSGIASFKAFLESILYHREEDNRGRQVSILREYLETQKPADIKDLDRPFLSQLWQAWSFANQNNNDYLASSISAVLALLLKTMSGILDLREQGLLLCRTVIQHQHLRLVKRCLDAPKHKDFVISPCLRLLTEVASFDGGSLATELYKRREQTFDVGALRRLLGAVKTEISEDEAKRKPALRTLTLRYILSLFKYLHEGGKIDVLKSKPLCNALFHHLDEDPADLVVELLTTVEQNLLKDSELPRSAKAAILTSQNLEKVTIISSNEHAASDKAFAWLKAVCQTPDYGILRPSGWYPPGTTKTEQHLANNYIDLGLDSLEFYDRDESINIRNTTLLSWTLTLRAHSVERERELLLICFTSAPELVAAYFSEKGMQLDPKLSNTWIGYASLLFEVVALDIKTHFGGTEETIALPPQTTIMIESILPRPLGQKILTRCLNQSSELITFFALRILVIALQKLRTVLRQLSVEGSSSLWDEAKERLTQRFIDRGPAIKDAISTFRKIPDDAEHALQREASTRVLALYYEVIPLQAMEEPFDVSIPLTAALARSESQKDQTNEVETLRQLELQHLLTVARYSAGMKWFAKQGGLAYSPIVSLLRIARKDLQSRYMRTLIGKVLTENGILNTRREDEDRNAVDALLGSVLHLQDASPVWEFLDDCIARAGRQPVKYVDTLKSLKTSSKDDESPLPSVFAGVLLEQASFVAAQKDEDSKAKASWTLLLLGLLDHTSDSGKPLQRLTKAVSKVLALKPKQKQHDATAIFEQIPQGTADDQETQVLDQRPSQKPGRSGHQWSFTPPPQEPSSHPELTRWSQKDIDVAIEDGDIDALILCLCSTHGDIRKQGLTQLNRLKLQLRTATYENASQISLLIGELTETFEFRHGGGDSALPYVAGTFAVRALQVLIQPHHFIYPKVNRFLIRGPEWRVNRLPGYWLSNTVLGLPEEDDAHWRETQWVLDWLVDGLRSPPDLDIYRRGDVFEKVMALWSSPGAASHKMIRERICELIFRACHVEGGSDTLITRAAVLSWLGMVTETDSAIPDSLREMVIAKADPAARRRQSGFESSEWTS